MLRFSAEPRPTQRPVEPEEPQETESNARTHWGFVALGVAAAATGAAIILGSEGLEARDRFEESGRRNSDERDNAVSLRLWTNVAWGVALVGAGTGAYLLLSDSEPTAAAAIPGGVVVSGRF